MKPEEHKQRFGLSLLMALLYFVLQLVAVLLTVGFMMLMVQTGILPDVDENALSVLDVLLFMGLISLIAGAILAVIASKYYMQPVNRFINQMKRLAAGDFSARIHFRGPVSRHPSVQEIQHSFNTAAEELEQTEMLRSDFINNFSHEFKTPIVSIAGFAKLLRRGNLSDKQREEYLQIIEEESLRLANMATSVLDLTKIENQTILTDVTCYNLSEQLRAAVLLLERKWEKKQLEFELRLEEIEISANEELLKHVWINLLDNAVKFAEDYSTIDIFAEKRGDKVMVEISNMGKPIPPESIHRIFQKFYQADESHSSEGSGVGLAIVKKVADLHGGTVAAYCCNGMTTFRVELPG